MKRPLWFALIVTGCSSFLGVPDLSYDEHASQGNPDGSTAHFGDGSVATPPGTPPPTPTTGPEGGPGPCDPALTATDPKNCGRCGHDCLGGTCTASKCDPVTLADSLGVPEQIAVDDKYLYAALNTDGHIIRVAKVGGAPMGTMLDNVEEARGALVDGTTLYFAGYPGTFKCTLSDDINNCKNTQTTLSSDTFAGYLAFAGGDLYAVVDTNVVRLPATGGAYTIGGAANTWDVATDGNYAYFTSMQINLQRAQVDGGSQSDFGPLNSVIRGSYVATAGDSVFWSYSDEPTDAGRVYGAKQANPSDRTTYTLNGGFPVGIAADENYVYWSDRGSLSGTGAAGDGRLLACPRTGCASAPMVLATSLRGGGNIVLDKDAIYFVENNYFQGTGRIRKVAKP